MAPDAEMGKAPEEKRDEKVEEEEEEDEEALVDDRSVPKLPDFELARLRFWLLCSDDVVPPARKTELQAQLLARVEADEAGGLYEAVWLGDLGFARDDALVAKLAAAREAKEADFEAKIAEAKETLGETDVRDLMHQRADYYAKIGDVEAAKEGYEATLAKTSEAGRKIDIELTLVRLALFWRNTAEVTKHLERAQALVDKEGDWDRRNRLQVYASIWAGSNDRDFGKASEGLLKTLSTFAANEFLEFPEFVWYAGVLSVVSLDRVALKEKVIEAPEVVQTIDSKPALKSLIHALYDCQYAKFFQALAEVTDDMKKDLFLAPHVGYFCKEMRIRAYQQLLRSYRSVQVSQFAREFGVTEAFVDTEVSRFIASGRLAAKIDKVEGVIETNRADAKSQQYNQMLRQGGDLLNRIQQLSRVVHL